MIKQINSRGVCLLSLEPELVPIIDNCFFQTPGLNIITEYAMGIIYPGRPIANVCFKTYGYMSMAQAISFLSDFKLGHYMKIPPRSMFLVQVTTFTGDIINNDPMHLLFILYLVCVGA